MARQPGHPRRPGGARPRSSTATTRAAPRCPTCASSTAHRAVRRQAVVPGQRDGRPVADRAQDRRRVRPARRRDRHGRCGMVDPDLELVACGSLQRRGCRRSATWERTVLGETYDQVDYISLPRVLRGATTATRQRSWPSAVDMDHFIDGRGRDRRRRRRASTSSSKRIDISFDEWNVWYQRAVPPDRWPRTTEWAVAPRLIEDELQRRRRRRRRQPADLAAAAHRPGRRRVPGAAGQRDRADHDRARRPGLAADHLPPVRAHLPARRRRGAPGRGRVADVRRPSTATSRPSTRSRRTTRAGSRSSP